MARRHVKGGKQPGAGRPPSTDPANRIIKVRLTESQHAKWLELGASKWIKRIIDENRSAGQHLRAIRKTP